MRRRLGDNLERSITDDKAVGTFFDNSRGGAHWTTVTCTGLRLSSVHTQLYRLLRRTFGMSGDFRALERERTAPVQHECRPAADLGNLRRWS